MSKLTIYLRATVRCALAVSAFAPASCSRPQERGQMTASPDAGALEVSGEGGGSLSKQDSEQVLARVGSRTITLGDLAAALEHMDEFDRVRYQAPARRKELLREMIDVMLLADEARDRGYDKDPATQEELRQVLRDAVRKTVRKTAPAPSDIAADEVRGYYEAHKADFHDPERRRASAIVLQNAGSAGRTLDAVVASAAASDGGSPLWGELVRTQSIDADAKSGVPGELAGDLGFVSPPGDPRGVNPRVPEEVRRALFDIPHVGEVYPRVVATGRSGPFYVLKLAAKVDAHDRSFEDAERSIRVRLADEKARANEDALIASLRKQYPVQVDQAALSRVASELARLDAGAGP